MNDFCLDGARLFLKARLDDLKQQSCGFTALDVEEIRHRDLVMDEVAALSSVLTALDAILGVEAHWPDICEAVATLGQGFDCDET